MANTLTTQLRTGFGAIITAHDQAATPASVFDGTDLVSWKCSLTCQVIDMTTKNSVWKVYQKGRRSGTITASREIGADYDHKFQRGDKLTIVLKRGKDPDDTNAAKTWLTATCRVTSVSRKSPDGVETEDINLKIIGEPTFATTG